MIQLCVLHRKCTDKSFKNDYLAEEIVNLMKKRILFILLSICIPFVLFAYGDPSTSIAELDDYIAKKGSFVEQKENTIKSLKDSLAVVENDPEKFSFYSSLFEEYKSYIHDSAFVYAEKHLELAMALNQRDEMDRSKIQIGFCYLSSGLFKEANDILNTIHDIDRASKDIKKEYYVLISRLYYDMADYSRGAAFSQEYINQGIQFCDSAISYLPVEDPQMWSIIGLKRMQERLFPKAIDAFQVLLHSSNVNSHTYAIATSSIGHIYASMGDTLRAKYYLSQAAIGDIKSATKEAVALQNLAKILYAEGDIEKANRYIRIAMEDANFYNARHRKIEISSILPIIEKERLGVVEKQRNNLIVFASIISFMFLLFLISTIIIYKQMKKLRLARTTIIIQNKELKNSNRLLTEANQIKDEYIVQSLYSKSEYIDRLDSLHKLVNRKLVARQYDDMQEHLKAYDVKKERENMFESFDHTFLKLFPTYREEYNKLFDEKDQIPVHEYSLTVEQRIFALIRLGISESERIANFLDYSVNTINTYKTKIKNKSIVENDAFEDEIMKVKTVGKTSF